MNGFAYGLRRHFDSQRARRAFHALHGCTSRNERDGTAKEEVLRASHPDACPRRRLRRLPRAEVGAERRYDGRDGSHGGAGMDDAATTRTMPGSTVDDDAMGVRAGSSPNAGDTVEDEGEVSADGPSRPGLGHLHLQRPPLPVKAQRQNDRCLEGRECVVLH